MDKRTQILSSWAIDYQNIPYPKLILSKSWCVAKYFGVFLVIPEVGSKFSDFQNLSVFSNVGSFHKQTLSGVRLSPSRKLPSPCKQKTKLIVAHQCLGKCSYLVTYTHFLSLTGGPTPNWPSGHSLRKCLFFVTNTHFSSDLLDV